MGTPQRYRLRGTNFAVERAKDLPRLALGAGVIAGPAAWRVVVAGRSGRARVAERRWARLTARVLGLRLTVRGAEYIDPSRTYVVAPLHEGFADVVALLHLPLSLRFVARDELADWPTLGLGLRSGRHVTITPEHPRAGLRTLLRAAPEVRDTGESLVVFPQGSLLGIEAVPTGVSDHMVRAVRGHALDLFDE